MEDPASSLSLSVNCRRSRLTTTATDVKLYIYSRHRSPSPLTLDPYRGSKQEIMLIYTRGYYRNRLREYSPVDGLALAKLASGALPN